jgi:chain length determinant protein EpsF
MTFEQFYRILRARRKLALSLFFGILVFAIAFSLLWPKQYTAQTSVMVDLKADPVSGMTQAAAIQPAASYLATQVSIIKSDAVARRVVNMLRLGENPEMRAKWSKDTDERGSFEDWLGKVLAKGLKVTPGRDSSIIEIEYESVEPGFAAVLANAFAKAYMDTIVQMRTEPAKGYTQYFEERAQIARDRLEQAQNKLAAAQKERGIVMTDERLDTEIVRLNEMGQQLVLLRSLKAESAGRRQAAASGAEQTPEVLANPVVATLKTELTRLTAKLSEYSSQYGDNHPNVVQIKASIDEVQRRINAETRRISGSLGAVDGINRARETASEQAYEEQRQKLLKLKEQRSELALIEREVDSAQRIYDAIQLRQSQSSLESNSSQSSVYQLGPAVSPPKHSFPNFFINVFLAITLGGIVTLLVTLAAELLDRRVRTAVDLIQALEIPVIGVLPSPNPPKFRLFNNSNKGFGRLMPVANQSR